MKSDFKLLFYTYYLFFTNILQFYTDVRRVSIEILKRRPAALRTPQRNLFLKKKLKNGFSAADLVRSVARPTSSHAYTHT